MMVNGKAFDLAMFVKDAECQKRAQSIADDVHKDTEQEEKKHPRSQPPTFSVRCVSGDDPSVSIAWRTPTLVGGWFGSRVFYYHQPERLNFSGAYVRAVPVDEFGGQSKAADIFLDHQACEKQVADDTKEWHDSLDLQGSAEHDPKIKAEIAGLGREFAEEKLNAWAACIPYDHAAPLVDRFCDPGLPLKLQVSVGRALYACDSDILRPYAEQTDRGG